MAQEEVLSVAAGGSSFPEGKAEVGGHEGRDEKWKDGSHRGKAKAGPVRVCCPGQDCQGGLADWGPGEGCPGRLPRQGLSDVFCYL